MVRKSRFHETTLINIDNVRLQALRITLQKWNMIENSCNKAALGWPIWFSISKKNSLKKSLIKFHPCCVQENEHDMQKLIIAFFSIIGDSLHATTRISLWYVRLRFARMNKEEKRDSTKMWKWRGRQNTLQLSIQRESRKKIVHSSDDWTTTSAKSTEKIECNWKRLRHVGKIHKHLHKLFYHSWPFQSRHFEASLSSVSSCCMCKFFTTSLLFGISTISFWRLFFCLFRKEGNEHTKETVIGSTTNSFLHIIRQVMEMRC